MVSATSPVEIDLPRPFKKPLLFLLVKRLVSFCWILGLLTIFLYGIGTRQEFMDRTQLLLLRILTVLGFLGTAGSLFGLVLSVWIALHYQKWRYLVGAGGYLLLSSLGIAVAAFAALIITIVGGYIK